ncbi:MAG TPA: aldehyde ferredoxin oxidoreductase C-terminal domain-containing protein [Deltaproteobacteria bacterium]|nr:aldehyde ferredoxin oxidoreductase C-terminal domain-containing protein [Deltaproteobacteria bacterium]
MQREYCLSCLYIDLKSRQAHRAFLDPSLSLTFLGGRGIGTWFLAGSPAAEALSTQSPLIFATGALTGSRIPSSARLSVSAFSPLTGTVCSCSVGGGLCVQMRKAGLDIIHVTGRADRGLALLIHDQEVKFEDIDLPADASLSRVFEGLRPFGGSAAAVGPAAMKGCSYASILIDSLFASGRGGLGLVMAAKNLRAVAVKGSGSTSPEVCDRPGEEAARNDIIRLFDASPAVMGRSGISRFGTGALVDLMASRRMMPTANFRRTFFEDYRAFSASSVRDSQQPGHYGCHGCPIACKQKSSREVPEYETLSHFGALNENADLASIIEANHLCNEAGMDTITAASTIACLAEIRGQRYAGQELVDRVRSITSDDADATLLRMGSAGLARKLGAPEKSMSIKGLELPAYDPRGAYGMALAYCTSTRGGCHLRAYPIAHEILRKPVATDRFSFSGKARIIKIAEDLNAVVDSIGACRFAFLGASLEEYAKGFAAVTGLPYDTQDLLRTGDAIYTLERHINTERGFKRTDDMLPERFYSKPGTSGCGIEIPPVGKDAFEEALDRYYRIRGCNPDGTVTEARLQELGLCTTR